MRRLPALTQPQKDLAAAAFTVCVAGSVGVLAALWVAAALVLGSVELGRWIGGW